jgi:DNA-binding CsgD family transcriptional regulator
MSGKFDGWSDMIGAIYDASLDPGLWTEGLARVAEFCGGQATALLRKNAVNQSAEWYSHTGMDPEWVALHAEVYCKYDPLGALLLYPPGQAVTIDRLMPWDDIIRSKFYQEWTAPQGLFDVTGVVLERSNEEYWGFGVMTNREGGRVHGRVTERLDLLGPHLRRAYKIGNVIGLMTQERKALADTIDGLAAAVLLADAEGRIVHANPRAMEALRNSGCLVSSRGRLMASDPRFDRPLQAALSFATKGEHQHNVHGMTLPMQSRSGEHYVLHTLPLTASTVPRSGMPARARVAVFLCPVAQYQQTLPEVIRATFGLTPTELRVMLAVVEVGGAPEVADALGLAVSTVKTHLSRVYAKTGVNRHTDLARLAASFTAPITRQTELFTPGEPA